MCPKVAFINQGTLMMAREVINVIKVENVNNVVQFSSTNVVIWDAGIDWWLIWACFALWARFKFITSFEKEAFCFWSLRLGHISSKLGEKVTIGNVHAMFLTTQSVLDIKEEDINDVVFVNGACSWSKRTIVRIVSNLHFPCPICSVGASK